LQDLYSWMKKYNSGRIMLSNIPRRASAWSTRNDTSALMSVSSQVAAPVLRRDVRLIGVTRTAWDSTLVLSFALFAGAAMGSVFGPLQEAATLELRLTDFQMSLVQGFAAGIPGAIIGLLLAWIIDHGNRVRLLV